MMSATQQMSFSGQPIVPQQLLHVCWHRRTQQAVALKIMQFLKSGLCRLADDIRAAYISSVFFCYCSITFKLIKGRLPGNQRQILFINGAIFKLIMYAVIGLLVFGKQHNSSRFKIKPDGRYTKAKNNLFEL